METIEQQALRMACDSFLSDYEGTPEVISNLNSIHNAPINESTRYECHTPKASRAQINTVCGKYFITNNLLIKNEHKH